MSILNPFNAKPLEVSVAQNIILDSLNVLGSERCDILNGLNRILCEDIIAPNDIPSYPNSAVDGYAVRSIDLVSCSSTNHIKLSVIGVLPAGVFPSLIVGEKQAVKIMTGGIIPDGADSVVMVENTLSEGNYVTVFKKTNSGENIRPTGEDIRARSLLMTAGSKLQSAEIGMLSAIQKAYVKVYRRPTVAILSVGSELVEVDEKLAPGMIVNSNSFLLASLVREMGACPLILPLVKDDKQALEMAVQQALVADFIVSSGGVSVGDYDYVKPVLEKMGLDVKFWRVWMKPGKPILYGLLNNKPYFGLPGNPVSSMVTFYLFIYPAIRKASGYRHENIFLPQVMARLEADVKNKGDRPTYLRAKVTYDKQNGFSIKVFTSQGSGIMSSMIGANSLLFLEEGITYKSAGEAVLAILIQDPLNL